jgi:hypothetical protein
VPWAHWVLGDGQQALANSHVGRSIEAATGPALVMFVIICSEGLVSILAK